MHLVVCNDSLQVLLQVGHTCRHAVLTCCSLDPCRDLVLNQSVADTAAAYNSELANNATPQAVQAFVNAYLAPAGRYFSKSSM